MPPLQGGNVCTITKAVTMIGWIGAVLVVAIFTLRACVKEIVPLAIPKLLVVDPDPHRHGVDDLLGDRRKLDKRRDSAGILTIGGMQKLACAPHRWWRWR